VGGPHDDSEAGSAWVYVRTGSTWKEEAHLAVGSTEGSNYFGRAVALSADGSTALIGDPGNAARVGAAWVFTRSGETWTRQEKLTGAGEVGQGQFGRSVALSGDGNVALIGAFGDSTGVGAAWTFQRSGTTWAQLGPKLTPSGESGAGAFGRGVALSTSGTTALIGASKDGGGLGAAWAFTRSGSTWEEQGGKLTGSGESVGGEFGEAVALSGDGSTGLVGGPGDGEGAGAAWVFTQSEGSWEQQGLKLLGAGESPGAAVGYSVSLSGDGSTALAGGYADAEKSGAAWAFTRSGSKWEADGAKVTGAGEIGMGRFGFAVALSGDASTALVGGMTDNGGIGAVWPFVAPSVPENHEEPPETGTTSESTPTTPTTPHTTTGSTPPPTATEGTLASTTVSAPVLGVTGNVAPVSGKVYVEVPGSNHFVLLPGLRDIPFGSVIEATEGSAQVTTASGKGGTQTGEFFAGAFILTQGKEGNVTATLTGGKTLNCAKPRGRHRRRGRKASAHAAAKRHGRKLWANAHGQFSTKGNYAVGAVQGTEWLTEDNCHGTLIRVTRDKVKVTDLVRHRSFIVHVGHSVLVKP
jgi:hypothetical protein